MIESYWLGVIITGHSYTPSGDPKKPWIYLMSAEYSTSPSKGSIMISFNIDDYTITSIESIVVMADIPDSTEIGYVLYSSVANNGRSQGIENRSLLLLDGKNVINVSNISIDNVSISIKFLFKSNNHIRPWILNLSISFYGFKDSDKDGIFDHQDVFPYDPSASVDTDGDGHPNYWNEGWIPGSPPTNLTIDDYPDDPNRWEKEEEDFPWFIITLITIIILSIILIALIYRKKRLRTAESHDEIRSIEGASKNKKAPRHIPASRDASIHRRQRPP